MIDDTIKVSNEDDDGNSIELSLDDLFDCYIEMMGEGKKTITLKVGEIKEE